MFSNLRRRGALGCPTHEDPMTGNPLWVGPIGGADIAPHRGGLARKDYLRQVEQDQGHATIEYDEGGQPYMKRHPAYPAITP